MYVVVYIRASFVNESAQCFNIWFVSCDNTFFWSHMCRRSLFFILYFRWFEIGSKQITYSCIFWYVSDLPHSINKQKHF